MESVNSSTIKRRSPIVAVMGHVDHGKTKLLDYIRKTNIADREAGGITQAISAYEIIHPSRNDADFTQNNAEKTSPNPSSEKEGNSQRELASSLRQSATTEGRRITFIDTPGHEAFSKMRSRGARVADLAILVVAADEGVKPQTEEAYKTLLETKTPFVVAISKIDKPEANLEKVKADLAGIGVLLEGYGGDISWHAISSKSGEGVNDLLDLILLAAEMENLEYDPMAPASGFILEARLSKQRGNEAAVIIKNGTLRQGVFITTPTGSGKVKILEDFMGRAAKEIAPSSPALIVGFDKLPQIGEEFTVCENSAQTDTDPVRAMPITGSYSGFEEDKSLRLILKSSDAGSLEALSEIVRTLPAENIRVVAESVGEVGDNDIRMAISCGGMIIGFKSKVNKAAEALAQVQKVRIVTSDIVYKLLEQIEETIKAAAGGALRGQMEVLAIFRQEKEARQLVGGKIALGTLKVRDQFRVIREGQEVGQGRITSIHEGKTEVSSTSVGREAGIVVSCSIMIVKGDLINVLE